MKKLLDIIRLDELNQCYQLQLDFKTQRHNLKRYLKSLGQLKSRLKVNLSYIANSNSNLKKMSQQQSLLKKKNSQLDYYILNGTKVFKSLASQTGRLQTFYSSLLAHAKDLISRIEKYLDQSKDSFNRVSKQHEKVIKQYAQKCYPQTTSILYMIGFVDPSKIIKIEDNYKEQAISKQSKLYISVLNSYLDQMEALKDQNTQLFKEYYMAATHLWIEYCDNLQKQMHQYTIDQTELQQYYQETGGAMTDRSDRSGKPDNDDQQN